MQNVIKIGLLFGAALVLSHARGFQADMRGFGAWPEAARDLVQRWKEPVVV